MIQTHLLGVQILWMMFTRTLMVTNQTDKEKILIVFDDIIANITTNKKPSLKNCLLDVGN